MNMTADNPVLTSPRAARKGNDQPTRVRAFKAVALPSIRNLAEQGSFASVGRRKPIFASDRSVVKLASLATSPTSAQSLLDQSSKALLSTALGQSASKAQTSQNSLPKLPFAQKRRVTLGAMGYADELFEMRLKQHEIKQYRRNMVDPHKFTFQRHPVPRQPDDFSLAS